MAIIVRLDFACNDGYRKILRFLQIPLNFNRNAFYVHVSIQDSTMRFLLNMQMSLTWLSAWRTNRLIKPTLLFTWIISSRLTYKINRHWKSSSVSFHFVSFQKKLSILLILSFLEAKLFSVRLLCMTDNDVMEI